MEEKPGNGLFWNRLKQKILEAFGNNSSILDDCALINLRRIYYLSLIVIPSRLLHIYLFTTSTSPAPELWQKGIIFSHLALLAFWIVIFLIVYRLKNREKPNLLIHILQYLIPAITMAAGILIVVLDQLITTNITPFLSMSIVVGAVFLLRPFASIILFLISYCIYYFALPLTIANPEILLSNRVNGTTAIAIGLLISLMSWHYNYINIFQKRHIEEQQKQLKKMAYYDQLTGLCNRHFFNQIIEKEFSSIERYGHTSVIIILDIDNFKNINDTFGHFIGDQVLQQFARLLEENIRKCDTVSRFGGEEFIILAPKISLDQGAILAEKLRKIIVRKAFLTGNEEIYLTASFGVSLLGLTKTQRLDNYYSLADKALYLAKSRGKNRVEKTQE